MTSKEEETKASKQPQDEAAAKDAVADDGKKEKEGDEVVVKTAEPRRRKIEYVEARYDLVLNGCLFFFVLGFAMIIGLLRQPLLEVPQNLDGKSYLIVGCMTNNMIGLEGAKILADWNATQVVCTVGSTEDEQKLKSALSGNSKYSDKIKTEVCDMRSFDSVKASVANLEAFGFDGILVTESIRHFEGQQNRVVTKDGFDEVYQVNHLSPFLLLAMMEKTLETSKKKVRVAVSISDWYLYGDVLPFTYGQKPGSRNKTVERSDKTAMFLTFADTQLFRALTIHSMASRHPKKEITYTLFSPGLMDIDMSAVKPEGLQVFNIVERFFSYLRRDSRQGALRGIQAITHPFYAQVTSYILDSYFSLPRVAALSEKNMQLNLETSQKLTKFFLPEKSKPMKEPSFFELKKDDKKAAQKKRTV